MIRFIAFLLLSLSLSALHAQVQSFTFAHMSDPHVGVKDNDRNLKTALADLEEQFPEVEFIILSGDITEYGYESEYEIVKPILESSKRPIYTIMGNHDVRWSDSGKENYRRALGETYKQFDYKGVRFILMDSSMLIEHYGHLDGIQMKKLEEDLKSAPEDGFSVVSMHHPALYPGHFIDNEFQFAELISNYNVPLVMDGHRHNFNRRSVNGTTYAMGGSVSSKGTPNHSYRIYRVEPDQITAITRIYTEDKTETEEPVPTDSRAHGRRLTATLGDTPGQVSVQINDEPFSGSVSIVLDKQSTSGMEVNSGNLSIPAAELINGIHQLTVEVPDGQTTLIDTLQFETAHDPKTTITRRFQLDSGNQSHPAVFGDVLYVGANDGYMRAFDLADPEGKLLWQRNLNSEVLSSPAVTTGSLVVGSMDSHVYCLDPQTGDELWKFKTNQAVLASPLVTTHTVYIGSGDKNMYALDLKTGEKKWSFAAEQLIKATPALANGRLFFGAWDNFFYALDAENGELIWKVPVSHHASGWLSAATSNPVVSGDNIIVCSHDYTVRCLNQATGATMWAYKPEAEELGPSYSTAVTKDDVAYFGSISGRIVGHNVETGRKVFDLPVRAEKKDDLFDSVPRLRGDKLYIGSVGGNVYCVDISKQQVDWSVALQPGFIFTGPALWRDRVLVGSLNNMVYEIQEK